MKTIDKDLISKDAEARLHFLESFVGFGDDDWKALQDSVAVIGPKLPGILDALYSHLLSFDDTKKIFLGTKGELDPNYIAIRKEHLTDWVLKTIGATDKRAFANYVMMTGKRHTGVEGDPNRVVPPRYMVALTGFVQTALIATAFAAMPKEPEKALRIGLAWNKMMIIQLEMFLKVLAPHWPKWDEG